MCITGGKGAAKSSDRAIKGETEWTLIDDSFDFHFSLYPNDLVRVNQKGRHHLWVLQWMHRGNRQYNLWAHDRTRQLAKKE